MMNSCDLGERVVFSPAAASMFPGEINNAPRQAESCSSEVGRFPALLLLEMIFTDYGIMRKECTTNTQVANKPE